MRVCALMVSAVLAAGVGGAGADEFQWDWNRGDPGNYGLNDQAGTWKSVSASYNTATQVLNWNLTFDDQKTDGITLVLSDGPNAKGHVGTYAIIYMEWTSTGDKSNPRMSAYAYNGDNSRLSFLDGDGDTAGNQAPDLIHSMLDQSWVLDASVQDVNSDRVFSFSIDASTINAHNPLYGTGNQPWFGTGFGSQLGLWLHSYDGLDARYFGDGAIKRWDRTKEGWFDGEGFDTTPVGIPMPAAAMMGFVGVGVVSTRRRR